MTYPLGVVTRTITVGDSLAVESGTGLTVRATLRSSRGLVWVATGERAVSAPEVRESATAGDAVSFAPPVTDQAGWRDLATGSLIDVSAPGSHTHTYTIELVTLRDVRPVDCRVIGPFPLPTGDGSPVDADLLIEADTVPGLLVSVPDSWGAMVAAAEAAAEEAANTAEAAVNEYLTANPPPAGDPGREVELQTTATHVQWRYVGDATWLDLIPLALISGRDGDDGNDGLSAELRTNATHIQWRQAGGAWADLIPLASLVGPAGPPNTLTIGTVTTLPAGSPATLSLTGEAPEQVLSAGIPMGLTGAASDWLKVGPGDPRTPSTTSGQITGTEPNGCMYHSTDGGGVGGFLWRKVSGSWRCVIGDTGPIALAPSARWINEGVNAFAIRRVAPRDIIVSFRLAPAAATVGLPRNGYQELCSLPVAWLPEPDDSYRSLGCAGLIGVTPGSAGYASAPYLSAWGLPNGTWLSADRLTGRMQYRGPLGWPTTLTI